MNQLVAVGDKIDRHIEQIERHRAVMSVEVMTPPRRDTVAEAVAAFEREIHDRALLHAVAAILPTKRDVHHQIKCQKTFAALRRSPNDGETGTRDDAFDEIVRSGAHG